MSKTQLNTGSQATPLAEPATAGIDFKGHNRRERFRLQLPPRIRHGVNPMYQMSIKHSTHPPRPDATLGLYLHIPFCR